MNHLKFLLYTSILLSLAFSCSSLSDIYLRIHGNNKDAVFSPVKPIYVYSEGNDTNSGFTPDAPVLSLQKAINLAKINHSTNLYISGNFLLTNTNNLSNSGVRLENIINLDISGGWNSNFTAQIGESILNGGHIATHVVNLMNCSNVVLTNIAVIQGYSTNIFDVGGGIYISNCNNCSFYCVVSNNCSYYGGGYYIQESKRINVFGTISSNLAYAGGGMNIVNLDDSCIYSEIIGNVASYTGGGVWLESSINNTFSNIVSNNRANYAGGFYVYASLYNTFSGIITYNMVKDDGGGMYLWSAISNTFTSSFVLQYNHCNSDDIGSGAGGGIYAMVVTSYGNIKQSSATNPNYNGSGTGWIENVVGSY